MRAALGRPSCGGEEGCDGVQQRLAALSPAAAQAQRPHVCRRLCRRLAALALRSLFDRPAESASSARTIRIRPRVRRSPLLHPHRPQRFLWRCNLRRPPTGRCATAS
eukprot:1021340-Pleurochrysis_carterae.AAC.1